jgi:hypothetical protein
MSSIMIRTSIGDGGVKWLTVMAMMKLSTMPACCPAINVEPNPTGHPRSRELKHTLLKDP